MKKRLSLNMFFICILLYSLGSFAQGHNLLIDEPIAYIGHGAMFNSSGREIEVTREFVNDSIAYYQSSLSNLLDERQINDYMLEREKYEVRPVWHIFEDQIIQVTLLKWLVKVIELDDAGSLMGKTNLLERIIKDQPGFMISEELIALLPLPDPPIETRSNCDSPGIWPTDYEEIGVLNAPFISNNFTTKVYVNNNSSDGLCVALPRSNNQGIRLFGVICQEKNGRSCFWDNQSNGMGFIVDPNSIVDINAEFAKGEELFGGDGGVCSDCHAGENAFVIHPNTNLLPTSFDTSTDNWHAPEVHPDWPQNPGPGTKLENLGSAQVCAGCHNQGTARRFPILEEVPRYCNSVLRQAIGNTMPSGGPNLLAEIDILCSGVPKQIVLHEGNNATQDEVCTINLESPVGHINFKNDNLSCENDEARSAELINMTAGDRYKLFDDSSGSTSDDYVTITIKRSFGYKVIGSFEPEDDEDFIEDDDVKIDYCCGGNLDGKVSSFRDF